MTLIISLGGSIIVPEEIDIGFLKKFRDTIIKHSKKEKIVIITGGGKTCRKYISAAKKISKISNTDADWIGIKSTSLNAELVRSMFSNKAYHQVIQDPTKKIATDKKILISCGWMPGCSSDLDAVLIAKTFKADKVVNLTNIDHVYDKDPKKFKDAKPIKNISWKDFRKLIGNEWLAGKNLPFDPIASKKAQSLKLKVIITKGTNIENIKNILNNKKFIGTVIY